MTRFADLFTRSMLIYIPAFNCQQTIASVLQGIPKTVREKADVLVIDNCSTDETVRAAVSASCQDDLGARVHIIRPPQNLGYAGSQKLAYTIACEAPAVQWIAMLHGDGQYPPSLLEIFERYLSSTAGVVYGYRSKAHYPCLEETPLATWAIISALSVVESLVTGVHRKEWHTGFVMYATRFLKKVNLTALTHTPHIDGNLLFAASVVGEAAIPVPIYKRYKALDQFEGAARRQYVIDVVGLMLQFRRYQQKFVLGTKPPATIEEVAGGAVSVIV